MIFIYPVVLGAFLYGMILPLAVANATAKARHVSETPDQIFLRVWPSVVAVDMVDAGGNRIGPGSGVLIGEDEVITTCQVVKEGKQGEVRKPGSTFKAVLQYARPDLDLCQLRVPRMQAVPIVLGTAKKLRTGQRVYAIGTQGAREGREPILSDGVISSLRPYQGSQYIEISALVSPASSGGGLFDDQGRLIGILSRRFIEGQHLTFALPVDWISKLAKEEPTASAPAKKNGINWLSHALALEKKADWHGLLKLSRQEVKRNPANAAAWFSVGTAFANLKQYDQAIPAYREAIHNETEYGDAWHSLGVAYANLKEYDNAIRAYEDALRMQPDNAGIWYDLGNTYYNIKQYAYAVHAYRDALSIQPANPDAWYSLGNTYDALKLYGETIEAYRETVRIQPENAEAWYSLGVAYARLDERDKMREVYQTLRKLDPTRAERYFNTYILP
ncbi:tetratricopeptide repeat-containing serine protease family protein [Nitrosospira sp. Nsp1]|uniref:tetratricopeptide repeat-containing S1 family peptidase n=1 Tax=Nitrosospira sp. Nsp1 TaxID=136547 RepID=UPI000881B6AA|nr:tetratricopeptide repeat-containing serine protease family protein [Nitrosospira sp. Nsp1]SCX62155.1 Tetratricopeptide repeat-containing protein [Nitrosospira sp. Nsp1]